jgi:hypothetical protein
MLLYADVCIPAAAAKEWVNALLKPAALRVVVVGAVN